MTGPATQTAGAEVSAGPRVLIVEDDVGIATQLVRGLVRALGAVALSWSTDWPSCIVW